MFLVHVAVHSFLGAHPSALLTLNLVMSYVHVKLKNFGKSDCSLSWRDYLNWSHPDSIWVPDDVVTAWLSAGDLVSPMVNVDMDLQEAFGKVFGTVWTHHPFLRPFTTHFFQGTRLAWLQGHVRGTVLLLSRTPFLEMIQPLRFVMKVSWAETTFDLHIPIVMGVIVLFVFFPSFGLKVRTDPTLGVMKGSEPPEVIFKP